MSKLSLPTKEELETLYREKGHNALIWYAWRNMLRTLPALGSISLQKIWPTDTVRHVYATCRTPFILIDNKSTVNHNNSQQNYIPAYIDISASDVAIAFRAVHIDINIISSAVRASVAAYAVLQIACADAKAAARAAAETARTAMISFGKIASESAYSDYLFLCRQNKKTINDQHFTEPLWKTNTEIEKIQEWISNLTIDLQKLGLGFLANDLNLLWKDHLVGSHIKNYSANLSETIASNSELLYRVIINGESIEKVHTVRVLLLGSGGAGKSFLADRLQGLVSDYGQLRNIAGTLGINYLQNHSLNLKKTFPSLKIDDDKLDLFIWDFGGQTIFHGLHSAFLHENCVYILVVDSRHEQAPDEWLYQIRHLAGSQANVLLVTNWYEHCDIYQNKVRLLREFPDLLQPDSFFHFSFLDTDTTEFNKLVNTLAKRCLDSQKMIMKETLNVQQALTMLHEEQIFIREKALCNLIIDKSKNTKHMKSTINQLEQLGFLFKLSNTTNNRYCLKPAWAIDTTYQLLYLQKLRRANGVLCWSELVDAVDGELSEDYLEYLLDFMQERDLCHKIAINKDSYYFFPDASTADEPSKAGKLLSKQKRIIIRFDLPYLPIGLHARLVNCLFNSQNEISIISANDIWRHGFILHTYDSQAVVQYFMRKNIIELTLTGNLYNFSKLLSVFYTHLKSIVVNANGIRIEQINPSVLYNKQMFSVHSSEGLIDVLSQIDSYRDFFIKVREMASKINIQVGDGSQLIIGDHNTQKSHSDNTTITVTADQRQIISTVLDEMLEHKLPKDITKAVVKMQDVVEADAEKPTEKTQSLLSRFIGGVKQIAGFTDDANKIGEFVAKHQDDIGAVLTSIQSSL